MSTTLSDTLKTPLHERHLSLNASMAPFAGWDMPIRYGSIADEHTAVRTECGIFDVSHMGRLRFRGRDAAEVLEQLITVHVPALAVGRAKYGFVLNEHGGVIDDVILYCLDENDWLLVVNASNRANVLAQMDKLGLDRTCMQDDTALTGMMALQGPHARSVFAEAMPQHTLPEYSMRAEAVGDNVILTTGYTGEDGLELIAPAENIGDMWDAFLKAGAKPIGLGARDTLRLEMGYPLHGHELTPEHTPWQAGIAWGVDLRNESFHGREHLVALREEHQTAMTALKCSGKGVPRSGQVVLIDGKEVGHVTSGTFSPSLQTGIALAYVCPRHRSSGTDVAIAASPDARRQVAAQVVKLPFYTDGSRKPSGPGRKA